MKRTHIWCYTEYVVVFVDSHLGFMGLRQFMLSRNC